MVISGGWRSVAPSSQSKLVTTSWAPKDANFGVATSKWYDNHSVHLGTTTAIRQLG
jgi:hypothetical protein